MEYPDSGEKNTFKPGLYLPSIGSNEGKIYS